jgi:cytochrome c-type biogenesis protein CcmH
VTQFIIICAVMLVAAVALVAVPLVRAQAPAAKGEKAVPRATGALVAMALALPAGAIALYSASSNFPWDNPQAAAAAPPGHAGGAGSMADVTTQLEARLAANPQDRDGWQMLGRTYLVTGQPAKAVTAYERGNEAAGGQDPELLLDIAEALILTEDPAVQGRAKAIVDSALAADALNGKALWYSGVIAVRSGDNETAKANWQKLLAQNPPEEIRQILVAQLGQLGVSAAAPTGAEQPAMGGMGSAAGSTGVQQGGQAPAASGRTVRVAVSVDPSLASKLKPGVPLFVSARQPGIPGPPLAAVRLTSDDLPTTVVLSDANSMIEGRNLSSVDDVEVVARVAFGGTAVTASGDLVGTSVQKKGGSPELAIVIDKVAP